METKFISYSQFSLFKQCQKNWFNRYVLKEESESGDAANFGTSIHETIQNFLLVMYNQTIREAKKINLFEDFGKRVITLSENIDAAFIEDGSNILEYFSDNFGKYFPKKNHTLIGIEFPVEFKITEAINFFGKIDILIKNEETGKYIIYDLKTSYKGWSDKEKKDEIKISQLLLYKYFLSKQLNIDINDIEIKYLIMKRKIFESENAPFKQKRFQEFSPASGKIKIKNVINEFNLFLDTCYNNDGTIKIKEEVLQYANTPKSCTYCTHYKTDCENDFRKIFKKRI